MARLTVDGDVEVCFCLRVGVVVDGPAAQLEVGSSSRHVQRHDTRFLVTAMDKHSNIVTFVVVWWLPSVPATC